jgi:hypothetical protein
VKLFAKLPKEVAEADLDKNELMRLSVVYELIETEIDYVNDLKTMLSFHKVKMEETKIFSDNHISMVYKT